MRPLVHVLITALLYTSTAIAQQSSIKGRVIDASSKQAIEYATVTVTDETTHKIVNGATSDNKGLFTISDLPQGIYTISTNFLGYAELRKNTIRTGDKKVLSLGDIALSPKSSDLKVVTISAARPLVENKIDKMVYNAAQDVTSQGGMATDVLKKVPQVSVDVDGNVQLQGNSNIRFLIDGKPSGIFGNSIADALQSIPASQIQSIEVVTSPGAKYDAEGTGGIINIILKKSQVRGINGNANISVGSRLESGSFNLNMRRDNFGLHAFASGNAQLLSTTLNDLNRISNDNEGRTTTLLQNGNSDFTRSGYDGGVSFDWSISKKDNLTGSIGLNYQQNHYNGATDQKLSTDSAGNLLPDELSTRDADNRYHSSSADWNLNYKRIFAKDGPELEILYTGSYGQSFFAYTQSEISRSPGAEDGGIKGNNPGTNKQNNLQIDYSQPVTKDLSFETGVKMVLSSLTSKADVYDLNISEGDFQYNPQQSYMLSYDREVYAVYASTLFSLFHFLDVKAGARYEYTHTNIGSSNLVPVIMPDYNTIAPSATISHKFKNDQSIKLSYTHRIQRPEYRVLNPFVNTTDPKNISTGNPALQPEIGDNIELGYNKSFGNSSNINIAVFHRRSNRDIQPYVVYYASYLVGDSSYKDVALNTYANIGLEENTGLNIYGSALLFSKLTLRSNLSFFYGHIINKVDSGKNVSSFNYRVNVNATYQFTDELVAEFFGNFNSARNEVQGRYPSFTSYNLAVRKQFRNKKASLALTATNFFNKYVTQATELEGVNFTQSSTRRVPYRSFGINFTYKFGKLEFKKSDEEKDSTPDAPNPGSGS